MSKKLVVSTIKPVEVGQQFESLPLHVTLVPWFEVAQENTQTLHNYLQAIARKLDKLELIGEDEDMFGPNEDVRVRRLASKTLHLVHFDILAGVNWSGGTCHSPYIAENYKPHVRFVNDKSIAQGEIVEVDALQVFDRDAQTKTRTVTAVYALGNRD